MCVDEYSPAYVDLLSVRSGSCLLACRGNSVWGILVKISVLVMVKVWLEFGHTVTITYVDNQMDRMI